MKLSDQSRKNLARLTYDLLEDYDEEDKKLYGPGDKELKLNMRDFSKDAFGESLEPNVAVDCGTTCCFLGYAVATFPEVCRESISWTEVSQKLFPELFRCDDDHASRQWHYLFGYQTHDNPLICAHRALQVLHDEPLGGVLQKSKTKREMLDELDAIIQA